MRPRGGGAGAPCGAVHGCSLGLRRGTVWGCAGVQCGAMQGHSEVPCYAPAQPYTAPFRVGLCRGCANGATCGCARGVACGSAEKQRGYV